MIAYIMGTHVKCQGSSNEYPNYMFLWRNKKNTNIFCQENKNVKL